MKTASKVVLGAVVAVAGIGLYSRRNRATVIVAIPNSPPILYETFYGLTAGSARVSALASLSSVPTREANMDPNSRAYAVQNGRVFAYQAENPDSTWSVAYLDPPEGLDTWPGFQLSGVGALSAGAFRGQVGSMVSLGALRPQVLERSHPVPASLPTWGNSLPHFVIDAPAQVSHGSVVTRELGGGRRVSYRRAR